MLSVVVVVSGVVVSGVVLLVLLVGVMITGRGSSSVSEVLAVLLVGFGGVARSAGGTRHDSKSVPCA